MFYNITVLQLPKIHIEPLLFHKHFNVALDPFARTIVIHQVSLTVSAHLTVVTADWHVLYTVVLYSLKWGSKFSELESTQGLRLLAGTHVFYLMCPWSQLHLRIAPTNSLRRYCDHWGGRQSGWNWYWEDLAESGGVERERGRHGWIHPKAGALVHQAEEPQEGRLSDFISGVQESLLMVLYVASFYAAGVFISVEGYSLANLLVK